MDIVHCPMDDGVTNLETKRTRRKTLVLPNRVISEAKVREAKLNISVLEVKSLLIDGVNSLDNSLKSQEIVLRGTASKVVSSRSSSASSADSLASYSPSSSAESSSPPSPLISQHLENIPTPIRETRNISIQRNGSSGSSEINQSMCDLEIGPPSTPRVSLAKGLQYLKNLESQGMSSQEQLIMDTEPTKDCCIVS